MNMGTETRMDEPVFFFDFVMTNLVSRFSCSQKMFSGEPVLEFVFLSRSLDLQDLVEVIGKWNYQVVSRAAEHWRTPLAAFQSVESFTNFSY